VAAIKALLSQRGAAWKEALNQPNLVHALNHKVVLTDAMVSEGDELAFFPPMTGG
jgi:molybdopterin synthase sulfur carrier subunit